MQKNNRAFIFVEPLIFVALIATGALASFAIVSLGGVRADARNASIKSNMSQMRLAAEIYYNNNGSYVGADSDQYYTFSLNDITDSSNNAVCFHAFSENYFCVGCEWPANTWCIDSTGYTGATNNCGGGNDYYSCK